MTTYLYLCWPFFFTNHSWDNYFSLV